MVYKIMSDIHIIHLCIIVRVEEVNIFGKSRGSQNEIIHRKQ